MRSKNLSFEEILVGDSASFERTISEKDVHDFAQLSGDRNPLHLSKSYAKKTKFGRRIVQGMLLGSFCSALIVMHLTGKRSLYLRQTFSFRKFVSVGDTITVEGKVKSKSLSAKIVNVTISIKKDDGVRVDRS